MPDLSTDPFHVTLGRLLAEREITRHGLSVLTNERFDWGSSNLMWKIAAGEAIPGLEGMRHIAAVLDVAPEIFAEYRLAVVREALDWRTVGLKKALKNLDELA